MTPAFENLPPRVDFVASNLWVVTSPLSFTDSQGRTHRIPVLTRTTADGLVVQIGFLSDGASIPQFAWSIIGDPEGDYFPAALIHDWLYRIRTFNRAAADWIILEAMQSLRVGWLTRNTIYAGVRAFGWIPWNRRGPLDLAAITPENTGPDFSVIQQKEKAA